MKNGTRYAQPGAPLSQEKFASSQEFAGGLQANLVAKRCRLLDDQADRELIWAIQYWSHQEGGLKKIVRELATQFPQRIGTCLMHKYGTAENQIYNASQVKAICEKYHKENFPYTWDSDFPLQGEGPDRNFSEWEIGGPLWKKDHAERMAKPTGYPASTC